VGDEDYMRQLAQGVDAGMDAILLRHHKPMFGYLYRMTLDERVAEDLVQETFVTVYQQGLRGFVPDQFKPWMYKIATNLCKDYWKKASTRNETPSDSPAQEMHSEVPNVADRQVERQWMIDALNQLPLSYRTALYLRFYQDLTYAEIAAVLDLPVNTVKTHVSRGLQQMENILQKEEEDAPRREVSSR
jgi:RNA polymerase sigma factor (sigma-70 family)